jgi:Ca2+-transporting ATPase
MITAGTLFAYHLAVARDYTEASTRTMVFTVLITANIFLTLVNRSFYYSVFSTMRYKNNLFVLIIGITLLLSGLLIYLKPLAIFFRFETPGVVQLLTCIGIGFSSVIWFEAVKWWKRRVRLAEK